MPYFPLTDYQVAAAITGCSLEEGSKVTTEEQCKLACQSMGKTFSAGTWDYCPGCFYYTGNENCHWNRRTNVKWNAKGNYEVCKKKEGGTKRKGEFKIGFLS